MKLCVIGGDGIGPEVVDAALAALLVLLPQLEVHHAEAGWQTFVKQGVALPQETLERARECGAVLFGAAGSPAYKVAGYRSPIVELRRSLACYANIRPTTSPMGSARAVDLVVVRENTEDLYIGEEASDGEVATALRRISRAASRRVGEVACALAASRPRRKLTIVHKANILPLSDGLFRDSVREVAAGYAGLEVEEVLVDTAAYRLAANPAAFDVLVAPNLYGDILSDLAAAFGGGLGVAPSLSVGEGCAIAEPVHGSAPDIAGRGIANPQAALSSVALLLDRVWQQPALARRLQAALADTLASGVRTPDLGGQSTSAEFTRALCARLQASSAA
ncbi:isocitrate/isopropylmalate dehydrogenase family protein [Crenobacter intestini]|uniref:Isocitrate/isopropylmalate dehydrogenase family protein n=1 Tax=Crenobacter intestini TaxID=2563443 RepID=A0A4T0UJD9_9NEIS|nr:isocitrate/isopropylmalate family dehydrogenase [Crenobacter intestini]TIC78652.1 isocitrate/isopropylmalate dehydrogenase family protein [Crenobacter intestini]